MNTGLRERLSLRGRLLVASIGALAIVLTGLTAAFNLVLSTRLNQDANSVAVTRATGELAAIRVTGGRISLTETPDAAAIDAPTWVFHGATVLESPRANPTAARAAAALAGGPRRFLDVASTNTRLYALPVVAGGRRAGTVVSAVALEPYNQTTRTALMASIALAVLVLAAIAITAWWLITRALRPVAAMTQQARAWSEHDLDRRFALGQPHDELTQLAATLDNLLGRLATSLRHEQRLTAELSHELRTPLAHITAEAKHALLHAHQPEDYRAGYEQILTSAAAMTATLDTLIAAARAELDPHKASADALSCAQAAATACRAAAEHGGVEIDISSPPSRLRVAADAQLVQRILAPLLENACRYATHRVQLTIQGTDSTVHYIVQDDGPGFEPQDAKSMFEPGQRGSNPGGQTLTVQGAGLGLALARRLARTASGDVTATPGHAGAKFTVHLPRT